MSKLWDIIGKAIIAGTIAVGGLSLVSRAQTPTGNYSFVDSGTITRDVATFITCPSGRICPPFVPVDLAGNPVVTTNGNALPGAGSYAGVNVGGNLQALTGVNPSGSVYAGQTDLASVAGTTLSVGTGAEGAGTPRVTVATDTATIAGSAPSTALVTSPSSAAIWAVGATAIAPPPNAIFTGVTSGGNLAGWDRSIKIAGGDIAAGAISDGANVTLGAKADAKSTATDTTPVTIMSVLKEISAMEQTPASRAVTNAGTFATQAAITAASGSIQSGALASGAFAAGSVTSGSMMDLLNLTGTKAAGTAAANSMLTGGVFNSTLPTLTDGKQAAVQLSSRGGVLRGSEYPTGAVAETASATGTTGATTATLATSATGTTYICGFSVRANATATTTGNLTVTGTITGTLNFTQWTAPAASGLGVTEMIFTPCVPASAANTSIAVVSAAPGTGGVVSSTAWGYLLTP